MDLTMIKKGQKAPIPSRVAPMLCTLTREPTGDPDYLHEVKWDGYRIISFVEKGKVRLISRSAKDYSARYPTIIEALRQLKHVAVIDGEAVVFNERGMPDFDALQRYNGHSTPITLLRIRSVVAGWLQPLSAAAVNPQTAAP